MKKLPLIALLFLGVFLFGTSCAKKSIEFKSTFSENKKYVQTTTSISKNEVSYSGNQELIDILLSENGENPQIIVDTSVIIASIQTEKKKNGELPFALTYIQTSPSKTNKMIENGDIFYGNCSPTNSLKIDSTSSTRLTSEKSDFLFEILEKGYETLFFEGKKMAIGDTVMTRIPMSLPMGGRSIDMFLVSTYTLKKINKQTADFDIQQTITADLNYEEINFSATGSGDGKCTYSLGEQYVIDNTTTFIMNMHIKTDADLTIEVTSTSLSKVENVITDREN